MSTWLGRSCASGNSLYMPSLSSVSRRAPRPRLEALLPPGLADAPVDWESMRIPGSPAAYRIGAADPRAVDPRSHWAKSVISQVHVEGQGALLELVDKTSPHAQQDLMVCYAGPGEDGTIAGLPIAAQTLVWATALNFIDHCAARDPNGQTWIAYNCDPHTHDRPSCQGEKRFHLHLIHWREHELAGLAAGRGRCRFADLQRTRARRLIDPFVYLGARVCADRLAGTGLGERLRVSPSPSLAPGLRLLPEGKPSPRSLQADILALHRLIDDAAAQLLAAMLECERPRAVDIRPRVRPIEQIAARLEPIGWLAPATRGQLCSLAAALRSPSAAQQRALRAEPERASRQLCLRMPAYALGLRPLAPAQQLALGTSVELIVQFKLLSDIGGAGVVEFDDVIAAKIGRNVGEWDHAAWSQRARFQRSFSTLNAAALVGDAQLAGLAFTAGDAAEFHGFAQGWHRGGRR